MNLNTGGWASPLLRLVARLRSDGVNSTTPVTEINGGIISATNADIALVAKGSGALLGQVPDGAIPGGIKRGAYATDWQRSRLDAIYVARGNYSTISGGDTNLVLSSAQYATVGGGQLNSTWSNHATVGGGNSNSATGLSSTVSGGNNNSISGDYATISGGYLNYVNSTRGCIPGGQLGFTRGIVGNFVFPACNAPIALSQGVTQSALLLLGRETTTNTPTVLTSNTSAASTSNQVVLPNNAAYSFTGEVIAGVTGAGDTARWTINGAIKRGASAATTAMVGTPTVTMTHNDAGAAAWTVAVTADTTNGGIKVEVTGAASTTIRWVAKITTTEMTY